MSNRRNARWSTDYPFVVRIETPGIPGGRRLGPSLERIMFLRQR